MDGKKYRILKSISGFLTKPISGKNWIKLEDEHKTTNFAKTKI